MVMPEARTAGQQVCRSGRPVVTIVGFHRPPAWDVLVRAVLERRSVRARYHGNDRVLCPHLLGWKNGRARVLSYQASGSTSAGPLNSDGHQRWRWMFVDELEAAVLSEDPWLSASNYRPGGVGVEIIEVAVEA